MRAVWLRETGGPEALVPGEAPDPVAGPGQALIDVELANITFVETQLRAGTAPFSLDLPVIPGNGVGGVVAAVGDGVGEELVGRRVVSSLGGSGGYAELAVVDAGGIVEVPDAAGRRAGARRGGGRLGGQPAGPAERLGGCGGDRRGRRRAQARARAVARR